jgi:hypothetical protein
MKQKKLYLKQKFYKRKRKSNDTQKIETLEDFSNANFMNMAKYMREIGDWLVNNHYNLLF